MTPLESAAREWQIVAARLIHEAEIGARLAPLGAVSGDPAAASSMLCEQVREFVPQRPVDFLVAKFAQSRIERDEGFPRERRARGAAHARVPAHHDARSERRASEPLQEFARPLHERSRVER